MQIPLQVTFEGSDPSEPVRVAIEREVERLEKHNRHIIGCHVCCNCAQSQTPSRQRIPCPHLADGFAARERYSQSRAV